jgi:hypothetical protein
VPAIQVTCEKSAYTCERGEETRSSGPRRSILGGRRESSVRRETHALGGRALEKAVAAGGSCAESCAKSDEATRSS